MPAPPDKSCAVCGRRIEWRRKWARDWERVRYCSKNCRSRGLGPIDRQLEEAILALLAGRKRGASICPSEAARAVDPDDWRRLNERSREAARRLVARGRAEVMQKGRVVDGSTARGPIRIRLNGRSMD